MHNNIMAAGSRDCPLMLAIVRYAQWRSRFLRYINTRPNGDALRKCILEGPYTPSTIIILVVPATDNSPAVPERTTVETVLNMSPENKAHFESEKEAIHLILTRIGDEIYSTVDACKTAHEMWEAIERLQQGESLNIQDVKTNLFWEFGKFTSRDGESMESYYSRMVKEVNELRAERITKNANPLALVATAQPYQDPYYQTSKSYKSYAPTSKASLPTRSHATTRHKGKEIAKPITPPSESASEEDNTTPRYKNDNQTGQFGNQRTMIVAGARETIGGQVMQQSGIQYFNCKEFGHFAKECRKPKRVKDSTYHKEKMLLCKQAEKGVPLQAENSDWLADTDEKIDEQELEAHYSYMAKIQEVPTADSGTRLIPPLYESYILGDDLGHLSRPRISLPDIPLALSVPIPQPLAVGATHPQPFSTPAIGAASAPLWLGIKVGIGLSLDKSRYFPGNPDSVSRSLKTSDLILEVLTAKIGLEDSIPTEIDDGYYDSEGDILFLSNLLIGETFL
ncbi:integrase, catalytic region, zinc finger, CCHC-type containing protein [Tanacetum coccineum]|uniref:Integrase, catalytic region, zinc finger, CCHC-type containing protein n=1 Tax=Tanacetum coccineum TaxID=301880 RepID=A0ABQ4YQ82_9ASTR